MNHLIVFSHLRWNFVYQRPQHLLSRMSAEWPVVFIEEPVPDSSSNFIEFIDAAPGVEVWRPHVRRSETGYHPAHKQVIEVLVGQALAARKIHDYWIWYYTPMALPFGEELEPEGVIFDCMDELSLFRGAPRELVEQEAALLRKADIVFTGGRSLYNAKVGRHDNLHCFPSSVDADHFRPGIADHPLQAHLPRPRVGYCGVIDERIDLDIVAGIAQARPDWEIVMVGPTAKIDPASLPKHANIHWLGQQNYADLPAFINGWDVCLMPFALNDATKFISPTKTLEYMACGRPSVSTAIRDVVEPYGNVVPIRADAAGFIEACDAILARTSAEQESHSTDLQMIVSGTSWDETAQQMVSLIKRTARRQEASSLSNQAMQGSQVTASARSSASVAAS